VQPAVTNSTGDGFPAVWRAQDHTKVRDPLSTIQHNIPALHVKTGVQKDEGPGMMSKVSMDDHHDAVAEHHRFSGVTVGDEVWQFDHLEAFAMRVPLERSPGKPIDIEIVVLFSNHCFSRGLSPGEVVDDALTVMDGNEKRVLDKERYALSRQYLPRLILELPTRHILVADPTRPNFVTFELPPVAVGAEPVRYAVFFEVKKDSVRRRRMLLRVQSAYILDKPSKRLLKADKMRFQVILKRAYG